MKKAHLLLIGFIAFISHSAAQVQISAKKRIGSLTMNGNPNEPDWDISNTVVKNILGSPNNTVRFGVLWDNQNLYIGITVTDASKKMDSQNPWDDDAVEIFIDAENNGGSYGANDRQFIKVWKSSSIWEKNNNTSNIVHAWSQSGSGYSIEMQIPWSSFGISNPVSGLVIGFDVACDDDDNGGTRDSQLMWAGDGNNATSTQNFGDLLLTELDTQPPTAPGNLNATNITNNSLTLNWNASTDNIAVAGYDIYKDNVKINSSLVATTSYDVSGLTAGTTYSFYTVAKDAAGNSTNSSSINATTISVPDTEPPTAPSNLTANNISFASLTVNWTASTDNVGVTGYDIYKDSLKINASLVTGITYNVSGLTASTTYSFYVVAKDAAGNSTNSSLINATTTSAPDTEPPTAPLDLAANNITLTSLTLNWTASTDNVGVTGYDVYKDSIKISASPVTGTTYSVSGLTASTTYSFYVIAKDAAGNSTSSSSINATTVSVPDTEPPTPPSNLTANNITTSSLTLTWTASTDNVGVAGYDVYKDNTQIDTSLVTGTTYNVTGLTASTTYLFYVIAKDAAGNSDSSSSINVTTLTPGYGTTNCSFKFNCKQY
jgi:chitodextrinase